MLTHVRRIRTAHKQPRRRPHPRQRRHQRDRALLQLRCARRVDQLYWVLGRRTEGESECADVDVDEGGRVAVSLFPFLHFWVLGVLVFSIRCRGRALRSWHYSSVLTITSHSGINVGSKQLHEDMLRFIETNKIKPYIDRVFPFEETPQAVEYLGKGEHLGKIVIRVVG